MRLLSGSPSLSLLKCFRCLPAQSTVWDLASLQNNAPLSWMFFGCSAWTLPPAGNILSHKYQNRISHSPDVFKMCRLCRDLLLFTTNSPYITRRPVMFLGAQLYQYLLVPRMKLCTLCIFYLCKLWLLVLAGQAWYQWIIFVQRNAC